MKKTTLSLAIISSALSFQFLSDWYQTTPQDVPSDQSQELFLNKCSQCHSIKQANDLQSFLPSAIEDTVQRMQRKPGSSISSQEAKQIYEYLVHQALTIHKGQLDQELQALPENKRKEEQAKLDKF